MNSKRTTIIYLYGPPAVGKTTVGQELAKQTGYAFLHGHLFTPIASALMCGDMKTNRSFRILLTKLRIQSLHSAISAGSPGILLTGVYVNTTRRNRFIEMLQRLPARIIFIRLTASNRSLMRRVTAKSRQKFDSHKIMTREKLHERLTTGDVVSSIPDVRSFLVDTDKLKPREAARAIIKKFNLS